LSPATKYIHQLYHGGIWETTYKESEVHKFNGHKFHELYWGLKEKYEDTKGIIRNRKSKKDRQHSGQKNKNNNLKNLTQKTKDRAHKPQFKVSLYNTAYKPYVSVKIIK
jgi:hypothetical protein